MGNNGKPRWKFSLSGSSSSSKTNIKEPPTEFVCSISGALMSDPVVVSSGQTFDRTSVQVCRDLGFTPEHADFTAVIPNLALKSTILKWVHDSGAEHPPPLDYNSIEKSVRAMMGDGDSKLGDSERDLLEGVAEKPPLIVSHAATEVNHRAKRFYSSSSDNVLGSPSLPFATRPMCYSSASSEIGSDDGLDPDSNSEDDELVVKLKSKDVNHLEQGVIDLRQITRTKLESRVSLCTPRLLSAVKPLIVSRYAAVQTNAVAALVNLSLEKVNKVKIVRSGLVPPLIDALRGGSTESQEHAAGALFSLALDDDNKTVIGVLGAIQPLLHALRSESERTRHDSAMALYHLTMVPTNRVKLVKLGAVSTLLTMVKSGDTVGCAVLVLCNLAACAEGRAAMLDGNAVEILVGMLKKENELGSGSTREHCVAVLLSLSQGSLRFKGLAREAGAVEVLKEVDQGGSDRAREKAKRLLLAMRGRSEVAAAAADGLSGLEYGVSRTRYRVGRNGGGANSSDF